MVDEVWASYRFIAIADTAEPEGIRVIDLGAGHASAGTTLCGRIIEMLKAESLLNESVGAGYIERNWPPALKASGTWPLSGLRQSFLNGALTRLLDPDSVLKGKVCEFVGKGEFGLGSGQRTDGSFERVWFEEHVDPADVTFDKDVFLLAKATAKKSKAAPVTGGTSDPGPTPEPTPEPDPSPPPQPDPVPVPSASVIRVTGAIPPELWNRLGTRLLPKLRICGDLRVEVGFSATVDTNLAAGVAAEINQALDELGVRDRIEVQVINQ